jgi:[ribosomal protein S18]-alanine N-acetyltransferase
MLKIQSALALCISHSLITLQRDAVIYRPYTPEDFAPLYAIEERCFQPPFRFSRRYMRQLVDRANAATWIAEQDGCVVGFAIVEVTRRTSGITAYIQTIEVLPEQRGDGIGNQLLGCIEASARTHEATAIWLHVDAENVGAIRLYEANGYLFLNREEDYYAQSRAALIYSKPLKAETYCP